MRRLHFFKLIAAIAICELAGVVGSSFTVAAIPTWYSTLVKPAQSPPSWLFAPVWTTLYAVMGVAAYMIWQQGAVTWTRRRQALAIFVLQLVLNAWWSILFFGLRSPGAALIDILLLWLAIVATIVSFYKISRPAAWLLVPYILWVSFAIYLNFSIWVLNR